MLAAAGPCYRNGHQPKWEDNFGLSTNQFNERTFLSLFHESRAWKPLQEPRFCVIWTFLGWKWLLLLNYDCFHLRFAIETKYTSVSICFSRHSVKCTGRTHPFAKCVYVIRYIFGEESSRKPKASNFFLQDIWEQRFFVLRAVSEGPVSITTFQCRK